MHTTAISSEQVEVPVRAMISFALFRISVIIQVPGVFPRPVQLLQAVFLLLCGFGQLLSLHFQLEGSRWWFWRRCGRQGGSGGRIWIFIATPSQHPSMSVTKHARQCLDNHGRARSRPNYTDDFSNEFEMCPRIDGLLFPIGKICRHMAIAEAAVPDQSQSREGIDQLPGRRLAGATQLTAIPARLWQ